MLLATAILILVLVAAAIFGLKSYRPARVPVVELARVPHDMRAKVNPDALLRLRRRRQRRAGRSRPPTTTPVRAPANAPASSPVRAPASAPAGAPVRASTTLPDTNPLALVQNSLAHNRAGAPRPGSYFRVIDSPSQETIVSDVRGPWAAQIVTCDGRITLPDDGADVTLAWGGAE